MIKLFLTEIKIFTKEIKNLDSKPITIFVLSTLLFIISWYFSNPKYFNDNFLFYKSYELVTADLLAFISWFIFDSILFFIIPFLFIIIGFKEKIYQYGLKKGNWKVGLSISGISILLFSPIIFFTSTSISFVNYFPLMETATDNLIVFLIYECLFILFIFSWEFIFRGFLLFGLEEKFGLYSIFIQMIPFVLLHNGKPFIETFAAIFGGLFLGYLAFRTRSIYYGFIIHTFILILLDILAFIKS